MSNQYINTKERFEIMRAVEDKAFALWKEYGLGQSLALETATREIEPTVWTPEMQIAVEYGLDIRCLRHITERRKMKA